MKLISMNVHQIHAREGFALIRSILTTAHVQVIILVSIVTFLLMSAHLNHVYMVGSVLTKLQIMNVNVV